MRRRTRRPVVDLPQPLSPTSASVSPGATVKLRPSTAFTAPRLRPKNPDLTWKCLTSFSTRSSGPSVLAVDEGAAARAFTGVRLRLDDAAASSPPPCGEGSGVGVEPVCTPVPLGTTPHPNPPPQGGRESMRLNLAPMTPARSPVLHRTTPHLGIDQEADDVDHLLFGLPTEETRSFRRVAARIQDIDRSMKSAVINDVFTPVASDAGERSRYEIFKRVGHPGCDDEILRRVAVEHTSHGIDIFGRPAPIARDIQHSKLER